MRWTDNRHFAALVLEARANAEHPGYVALQPLFDLIELIMTWFRGKPAHPDERRPSRSSFPPGI